MIWGFQKHQNYDEIFYLGRDISIFSVVGVQNKGKQGPCAGYQNPIEKLMSIPSFSDSA